ncbi:MAG: hypothetical protein JWM27_3384 [Gemmatimonadetes bacterium]|nr:hypothetical protein [Gemmatimonadota bacterium]
MRAGGSTGSGGMPMLRIGVVQPRSHITSEIEGRGAHREGVAAFFVGQPAPTGGPKPYPEGLANGPGTMPGEGPCT